MTQLKRFVEEHYADNKSGQGKTKGPINLNESLTPQNRVILKESRKASKSLKYKYPGYTIKLGLENQMVMI